MRYLVEPTMIPVADLKQHLEQFDDDVDYWEPDRIRMNTLVATGEVEIEREGVD